MAFYEYPQAYLVIQEKTNMKIAYYLSPFVILFFTFSTLSAQNTDTSKDSSPYEVSLDDPFYDILFQADGYTFEDLDSFYHVIKVDRKKELNYDNLRKMIIMTMYQSTDLIHKEDQSIIEYYAREIISIDYISNMDQLYHLLILLEGHWTVEKIKSTMTDVMKRNEDYIHLHFNDPYEILGKKSIRDGIDKMLEYVREGK